MEVERLILWEACDVSSMLLEALGGDLTIMAGGCRRKSGQERSANERAHTSGCINTSSCVDKLIKFKLEVSPSSKC